MTGPRIFKPNPPLADHIEYFGYWDGDSAAGAHTSRALPRGAVTAIIDVDGRTGLGFYTSDGRAPLAVPSAFVAGAGAASYVVRVEPIYTVITIHFRPAGALAFLGCPLGDLENALVGLPDLWGSNADLQYLDETAVGTLFDRVDALSAPGSVLLYDVVGKTLLEAAFMAPVLQSMADNGAPWLFGTDEPGRLSQRLGWSATVTDIAEPGNRYNRWDAPVVPMDVADVPRGYFVEATK
ncbi:DUF6597 domain-containing transcriptional factor [Mycobacterium sp.]|uniref:DUF6597 domain-containing transcriptional factor n=1 Tax=Mycobacterium sp. TaxID=1785 RepID=UPI0025CD4C7F|nr:DUF6597 domain-containing transcriptional factor [Mycobacterium sp.]